jgi:hypothetical protein
MFSPHVSLASSFSALSISSALLLALSGSSAVMAQERGESLRTRWAKDVSPDTAHREYPRPQLVRPEWQNLNGLWEYAIRPQSSEQMGEPDGRILVPFPVESQLSGVGRRVGVDQALWYRRSFAAAQPAEGRRLLLHFGAVDQSCQVWVNGQRVGEHAGGYTGFSFDISDTLREGQDQELVLRVIDPSDAGFRARGKQVREPRGIWYTPSTGIWQTVWLEAVPAWRLRSLHSTTELSQKRVTLHVQLSGEAPGVGTLRVVARQSGEWIAERSVAAIAGVVQVTLPIAEPLAWTPETPFLYDLELELRDGAEILDQARSYFVMREVAVGPDDRGVQRILLNGEPRFQLGVLDQGFWPDGLYTAPSEAALLYDLEQIKALGFDMLRKHVKVEPARWYYHCDRIGILVWQDMPNGDRHIGNGAPDLERSPESAAAFYQELGELIDQFRFFGSIVVWVPFNEGWGQFETDKVLAWTKKRDPSRLVDGPSGWTDRGTGDLHDIHRYPGPGMPPLEERRAAVLGEFGGLGLPLEGHLWGSKRNWGYRTYKTRDELFEHYEHLMQQLELEYSRGLSAAIYTQLSDVEGEVNGLLTYDRQVLKFDPEKLRELHAVFRRPPPVFVTRVLLPTSELKAQEWSYTFEEPAVEWLREDFDDRAWKRGAGGFGTRGTPGAIVRTEWKTPGIWLRRSFEFQPMELHDLQLRIHHDEDVVLYLNGQMLLQRRGYSTSYIDLSSKRLRELLQPGTNILAVHCRQTGGGQYIDVGILDVQRK